MQRWRLIPPPQPQTTERGEEKRGRERMEWELNRRGDACPQLLDLIPNEKRDRPMTKDTVGPERGNQELELSLAPPGGNNTSVLSLGSLKPSSTAAKSRTTSVPVVGWPPIRSFRRNLASSSFKPLLQSLKEEGSETGPVKHDNTSKGLFVKINMDGIPIGRKVDLKAHNSYEDLASAVKELFRDLLAVQRNASASGIQKGEEKQVFTGLLDGSGEYTLVYDDNEGDRVLVGDVPWEMFVSTAKRLRVLKSSELSSLSSGAVSRKRTATEL